MKHRKFLFTLLLGVGLLSACGSATKTDESTESQVLTFGAEVNQEAAVSIADLQQKVEADSALVTDVTLKGEIQAVCKAKGCWMTLKKPDGSTVRVTFKDYALFMPADIVGREVVVHGEAKVKKTSVEELKHYAEDAGKSEEEVNKITQAEVSLSFEADGVKVL